MSKSADTLQFLYACAGENPLYISETEIKEKIFQSHSNYFSIIWIKEGTGTVETEYTKDTYHPNEIYCFNTYHAFSFLPETKTSIAFLIFHPNFFCIETFHHEVGCNGVLFNQVYNGAKVEIDKKEMEELEQLFTNIAQESKQQNFAADELLFSYLKILLIRLTRIKTDSSDKNAGTEPFPSMLIRLINENFLTNRQPKFYASAMNISVKTLGNYCRMYFKRNITSIITEKIILKAKWELLHTADSVKEIAYKSGFDDEFYFSRFFKKHIGLSPKDFREKEWGIRKGFLSIP